MGLFESLFPANKQRLRRLPSVSSDPIGDPEEPPARRFQPKRIRELINANPLDWQIVGLIPHKSLVIFAGQANVGKTFQLTDLAAAVAKGGTFANSFDVVRKGPVVFLLGEGVAGFGVRAMAAGHNHGLDLDGEDADRILVWTAQPNLAAPSDDEIEELVAEIKAIHPTIEMLIIDPLASAIPGADENDAKEMTKVIETAKRLQKLLDCTVVIAHHSSKGGAALRGSTALRAGADVIIELKSVGGIIEVIHDKARDTEKFAKFGFTISMTTHGPVISYLPNLAVKQEQAGLEERILQLLAKGEMVTGKIRETLQVGEARPKKFLQLLNQQGKVQTRKVGNGSYWSLAAQGEL